MNKELIKTYFEEFNHWLNGGNILVYYKRGAVPRWWSDKESIGYYGVDNFSNIIKNSLSPSDVLVVIDDSYSIYRKALAEGKIIQLDEAAKFSDPNRGWIDLSCKSFDSSTHLFPVNYYRIKPEEHKFKKGDWVIHNGEYKQVTKAVDGYIDSLDNKVAVIMKEESLELWKPKDKEYFWYKNDLVKFHETQANLGLLLESARGCSYYPAEKNFEDYCEPFIGKLPSNL